MHGVLTCLPTAAAVQDLQRLFYKILNCGLSHENEPPPMLVFNLVAPHMWRDQVKYQHSSTSAEIPKTGQNTRIQRGEQCDLFFFASRFDAVELRSSPRLLATAQNTNFQVRLRGLWAMADALCAES